MTSIHDRKLSRGRCVALATLTSCLLSSPVIQAQTFTVLHTFTGLSDGAFPAASLLLDRKGNIYGTATEGGKRGGVGGFGTVFKIDTSGKYSVLYHFLGGADGAYPSTLITDGSSLYGTAQGDGYDGGYGVVYKLSATGETVLYSFSGGTDGGLPYGLIRDSAGNFYGTTVGGGDLSCQVGHGCGTAYKIDSAGTETVLYNFTDAADGGMPTNNALVRDAAGNLYGTTQWGGSTSCSLGCGTIFKVTATGTETVLHHFSGADGEWPEAGLVPDTAGNLYGITGYGGNRQCDFPMGCGSVFRLDKTGHLTTLHTFSGPDGDFPSAPLVLDSSGNAYGTAYSGGVFGAGTIFKIDRQGTFSILHNFNGSSDGANPSAGLVLDSAGNLYGTTYFFGGDGTGHCNVNGKQISCGTVFKLTP
jgi:uncharacterized repeat protein (TIGR03803 family)